MCKILSKPLSGGTGQWTLVVMSAVLIFALSARAAEKKPESTSDESAIRAAIESYVAAYNRGDAKALAAHWSESGEWISPTGQRFRGREAIAKELGAVLAENKGVRIEVPHPSIRIVSPDAAVEEGTARVIYPGEPADESTYVAVHVKKDGHWKLDSIHETSLADEPAANSPLQELAWLVGEWSDQSPEADVAATVKWTKNKTFLNYSFSASAPGMDALEGTLVIGWDPAAETIRSWMFDSDGGFGEGTWSKKDNHWIVKFKQVLPDGRKASATNIYTLVDANTFTWKSIGREVDGEFLPNVEEVKIVRKTAGKPVKEASKPVKEAGKPKKEPRKPGAKS